MYKLVKGYFKLYNEVYPTESGKWSLGLRYDRVKHGFVGDLIKIVIFIYIGDLHNWEFNSISEYSYLLVLPFIVAFIIGFMKEVYDERKKKPTGFDWGDIWATVLPFVFVYHIVRVVLILVAPKLMSKIEFELFNER